MKRPGRLSPTAQLWAETVAGVVAERLEVILHEAIKSELAIWAPRCECLHPLAEGGSCQKCGKRTP